MRLPSKSPLDYNRQNRRQRLVRLGLSRFRYVVYVSTLTSVHCSESVSVLVYVAEQYFQVQRGTAIASVEFSNTRPVRGADNSRPVNIGGAVAATGRENINRAADRLTLLHDTSKKKQMK